MAVKIFVYGTLRKGMYNYDLYLKDKNSFRSYGYVKGTLMTLKDRKYPALLLEGNDYILGEIHEVDEKFVSSLDDLECYFGENDIRNEYNKIMCDIYNDKKNIIEQIPVYVYNDRNSNFASLLDKVIENGDFVEYVNKKSK